MCYCLLTLLHFKVVQSRVQDDYSDCVKPLPFQGKLQYAFTFYQYLSPACAVYQFLNASGEGQFTIKKAVGLQES
jgi:hypothetical protein